MSVYVVLGAHRSGTSAVAGVLYHLGVYMGDKLLGPGPGNPTGHFEDIEFLKLHDKIVGDWKNPQVNFEPYREAYTSLIRKREREHAIWGIKDPRMCYVFPYFNEIARGHVHVIHVRRDPDACAGSLMARGGHTLRKARAISYRYAARIWDDLANFSGLRLTVHYNRLVANPKIVVEEIANFVRLPITQEAIHFIDPTLCHQGNRR